MNFLAHLVLAPQTPRGLIGSIAPDMIRGPLPIDMHDEVMASAREHQRIDRFTDSHRAFYQTRDRLRRVVDPRLAGVLADVLYDHVLARDWSTWCGGDLQSFITQAERGLISQLPGMPDEMQWVVRKMVDEQWLMSYATPRGIRARLAAMSQRLTRRLGRPMTLVVSEPMMVDLYRPIAEDFASLWPDLLAHVAHHRPASHGCLAS